MFVNPPGYTPGPLIRDEARSHRAFFVGDRLVTPAKFGGRFSMRYVDDREDAGAVAEIRTSTWTPMDVARLLHADFEPDRDIDVGAWATMILQEVVAFDSYPDGCRVRVLPHGRLVVEIHDLAVYTVEAQAWADKVRGEQGGLPVLGYRDDTGWFAFTAYAWPPAWGSKIPILVDAGELLEAMQIEYPGTFGDASRAVIL